MRASPAILAMIAVAATALGADTDFRTDVRGVLAAPLAEGCVVTTLACNTNARGRLTVGDCTQSSDGTFFDVYSFTGTKGQIVVVDVRPLSIMLTAPSIILVPPAADASKTPLIFGGKAGVQVSYVLSSSGTWGIGVGTHDLFASGDYFISVRCFSDDDPSQPQNCIGQTLLCGQTALWYLTSQSCRFSGGSARLYADYGFYAVAGDTLRLEELSDDFVPLFGLYDDRNSLIASSVPSGAGRTTMTCTVPKTGNYSIAATSGQDAQVGFFTVSLACNASGCLEPLALSQPTNVNIAVGGRASLAFDVSATEPLTVNWLNGLDLVGSGRTFLTPPLFATTSYTAAASNPCGEVRSAPVVVSVSCGAPVISKQPLGGAGAAGIPFTFSITVQGSSPLTYGWFTGSRGDASHPIANSNSPLLTITPTQTTTVWARVVNSCGQTDSLAATVTLPLPPHRRTAKH